MPKQKLVRIDKEIGSNGKHKCSETMFDDYSNVAGVAVAVFVDNFEFFMAGDDGISIGIVTAAFFSLKGFTLLQNARIGALDVIHPPPLCFKKLVGEVD